MADFSARIPPVPSRVSGLLADWCRLLARQLNNEAYLSVFSGTNPNTSGLTGLPGNIAINIGSASTSTRAWILAGSVRSLDTDNWKPMRIA